MFDRKNITIGSLITAAILLTLGHLSFERNAMAETVVSNDFQFVTAESSKGDDGLFILNNRTGMVALFRPETGRSGIQLVLKDIRLMSDLLSGAPAPTTPSNRYPGR